MTRPADRPPERAVTAAEPSGAAAPSPEPSGAVAPSPAAPSRRVTARGAAAGAALLALGAGAGVALAGGDEERPAGRAAAVATATAVVERRDLAEVEDVRGTLGYAGVRKLGAAASGTVTWLRREGSRVPLGSALYAVDRVEQGHALEGGVPAYRELRLGVRGGPDVRQLERGLRALGHDPGTVDDRFDADTAAAVRAWEEERGATEDGVVALGEVVFVDGGARVGEHRADVGDRVGAGTPVLDLTSRRRVVTAQLDAGRQDAVRRGTRVTVTLPDGREVRGVVTRVGRVARQGDDEEAAPTVELRVALRGGGARLDGAPVTIAVPTERARRVLAVPLTALLATGPGRYAVELAGSGRRVPVRVGRIVDGQAEVQGVPAGTRVVVPA